VTDEATPALAVVLDTTILRKDPRRRGAEFRALSRLARGGHVRLFFPAVVVQEFIAAQEVEVAAKYHAVETDVRGLVAELPPDLSNPFDGLTTAISTTKDQAVRAAVESFNNWMADHSVTECEIQPDHGAKVVRSYFTGGAPFRAPKHRDDFPDAFIYQALVDVVSASSSSPVVFVTTDRRFADACRSSLPNLDVVASIRDLIATPRLATALREGLVQAQFDKVRLMVADLRAGHRDIAVQVVLAIREKKVRVMFPVDGVASIAQIDAVGPLVLDRPSYYGDGVLSVPFSTRVECTLRVDVPADRVDVELLRRYSEVRESEGNCEVRIDRTLVAAGALLIAMSPVVMENEVTDDELASAVDAAEVLVDYCGIFGGEESERVSLNTLTYHAHFEALEQIERGDLDITLDPEEETNRRSHAKPWLVPPELAASLGGRAEIHIAPIPRFENLVRILKQRLLEEDDPAIGNDK
jgi:hypothetical protein